MPRSPRSPILLAVALVSVAVLSGCIQQLQDKLAPAATVQPPSFADLTAKDAKSTVDEADGTRTFTFTGAGPGGVSAILVTRSVGQAPPDAVFSVDHRVGFVSLNLTYSGDAHLQAFLIDDYGRTQCGTISDVSDKMQECDAPVPANRTTVVQWKARVGTGYGGGAPGMAYTLKISLHPASHETWGDPLAGVDRNVTFRLVDPKAGGSESNIGVLPNGHVVAQFGLKTMLSTDDGKTWKDIAPPTTSQTSFDPMLYVDPYTSTIYVDQLYVGCSILAWSTDEGATWATNPAACGLPSDDHQKIITGPNMLPGAPCPAIYYSWSSITDPTPDGSGYSGVFVGRSFDCGLNFVPSQVVNTMSGMRYDNDMLGADRLGDVYVPMYMCDHGGYIAVGVSNDYGATFRVVKVDDEKDACTDPDPGIAVDANNTVYVAYHRADGIKYVSSSDHGKTWSKPVFVSPPTLKSFVHVDAIAGDAGKLAILYRATPDTDKGPDMADGWAAWHMYVTFVDHADTAALRVDTALVNPSDDPTQRGAVCTQGVACAGGSRNLLDFVDVAVGPDGRVYAVYADGCNKTCETPADSRANLGIVAILDQGPRLFADKAPWAKKVEPGLLAAPAADVRASAMPFSLI
jgi:hypothetical protein